MADTCATLYDARNCCDVKSTWTRDVSVVGSVAWRYRVQGRDARAYPHTRPNPRPIPTAHYAASLPRVHPQQRP